MGCTMGGARLREGQELCQGPERGDPVRKWGGPGLQASFLRCQPPVGKSKAIWILSFQAPLSRTWAEHPPAPTKQSDSPSLPRRPRPPGPGSLPSAVSCPSP